MDLPDPVWPVILLAMITLADAAMCVRPVTFVAQCLEDVRFPRKYWPVLTPVKAAAGVGLLLGLWIPYLALVTVICLCGYFVVAIGFHVRARDFSRNLFVNATGMLMLCVGTLAWSLMPW